MARNFIEYKLDKVRNLRLGMVAMMKIEKRLGKPFAQIDLESTAELSTVLWGSAAHEDADLTPDKVAELVDEYSDVPSAIEIATNVIAEAFKSKNAPGTAEKVENGTGTQPKETLSVVE